ncbi:MAG TPA: hypothetical protein VFB44_01920 [Thermoleophilaceae bacterium]|nr:hypothetical protein [Thermoleophilaceae bacterium]
MSSPGRLAVRLALLAVALAAVVAIVSWQRTEDDCNEAAATIGRALGGIGGGAAELSEARSTLLGGCHASAPVLSAAGALQGAGRAGEAEPLLRRVLRDEPDNFGAWATLSLLLADSDPAGARRARGRALELNPLAGR